MDCTGLLAIAKHLESIGNRAFSLASGKPLNSDLTVCAHELQQCTMRVPCLYTCVGFSWGWENALIAHIQGLLAPMSRLACLC